MVCRVQTPGPGGCQHVLSLSGAGGGEWLLCGPAPSSRRVWCLMAKKISCSFNLQNRTSLTQRLRNICSSKQKVPPVTGWLKGQTGSSWSFASKKNLCGRPAAIKVIGWPIYASAQIGCNSQTGNLDKTWRKKGERKMLNPTIIQNTIFTYICAWKT